MSLSLPSPITLPKFLVSQRRLDDQLVRGEVEGKCVFCGEETVQGFAFHKVIGGNFTAWQWLQGGTTICPPCHHVYTDDIYRKNSWIVANSMNGGGFTTLRWKEALRVLLDPPKQLPFAFYLSFSQFSSKHGWLRLINRLNYSRAKFFVAADENLYYVDQSKLAEYNIMLGRLRKFCSAAELATGEFRVHSVRRIFEEGLRTEYNQVREYVRRDPFFPVMVKLYGKPEQ